MFAIAIVSLLALSLRARAISIDETDDGYVVDTGSDPSFQVTFDSTCSINSLLYDDQEFQSSVTSSHIASGLGDDVDLSYESDGDYVIVTCTISNDDFDLTHYYVFKDGDSAIYMGTYTVSEPDVGELRYIARLDGLTEAYKEGDVSDTRDGTAIESTDIFLVGDETRSKYYSGERFIDDDVHCAYAEDETVYACFLLTKRSYEASSGGPFHRDINLQLSGDYHANTFYMNSGHCQTKERRQGFHGPYVLSFTSGIPSVDDFDTGFMEDLGLTGYVGESGRGYVSGSASGVNIDNYEIVLHWYNDDYQTWVHPSDALSFDSPALVEGTYTMALYQQELLAASTTVSVTAGETATATISATNAIITEDRDTIWQLGNYDGQPFEFLNGDLFTRMHPSDDRMSDWSPDSFSVDDSDASAFPMAIFSDVNQGQAIAFSLDDDISEDTTLRIATTVSFAGGRPSPVINDNQLDDPGAPSEIDSRCVTFGMYRGYGDVYEWTISGGILVAGENTLEMNYLSGSSGEGFLSPNFVIDAIELYYAT